MGAIQTIKNLNKLLGDGFIRVSDNEMGPININTTDIKRKNRKNNSNLICSRWIPILKDIIEDCIDDKLDKKKFPVLGQDHVAVNMTSQQNTVKGFIDKAANGIGITTGSKQEGRLGGWHGSNQKNVPRILVFIIGGATHSELRVGYEITADRKKRTMGSADWDVVIGGSEILTPKNFLGNLKNL